MIFTIHLKIIFSFFPLLDNFLKFIYLHNPQGKCGPQKILKPLHKYLFHLIKTSSLYKTIR